MQPFVHQGPSQRVVFGTGTLSSLADEIALLGKSCSLILSTPGHADTANALAKRLADKAAGVFSQAAMHTPVDITRFGVAEALKVKADVLVSFGGGSTIGLGKAIALHTGLPHIAIPTTYAGSEATPILGQTENGKKITARNPALLPDVILYDVNLTLSLPVDLTVTSGLNALAHAIEALYAQERTPDSSISALRGITALVGALPVLRDAPADTGARGDALYGAWISATCLGSVGMALHHKICHVLGGSLNLPHAPVHSVILPHAIAYNEPATRRELEPLRQLLNAPTAAAGLSALAKSLGAPTSLQQLGMQHHDIAKAASEITASPYWNPRPITQASMTRLLERAFADLPPDENP